MTQVETNAQALNLKHTSFDALFTVDGLVQLDSEFVNYLAKKAPEMVQVLHQYRDLSIDWSPTEISQFVIDCAPHFDAFVAELFDIQAPVEVLQKSILSQNPIFQFKKYYVQMHAKRMQNKVPDEVTFEQLHAWLLEALLSHGITSDDDLELAVAQLGVLFLSDEVRYEPEIQLLIQWCVRAQVEGQCVIANWQSFRLPEKRNYENLVAVTPVPDDPYARLEGPKTTQRQRDGFDLTDHRMSDREVQSEIHYCVYCHKTDGDFCSKGFPVKKNKPELGLKTNPAGDVLTGCPLEEKISEMHVVKKSGFSIGALAIIMIDNPMCAATGHRICNDCMKACIYQKQDPVNIPEVETRVLTDVLNLPWGVEIYDLFMRWNPLRREQYLPKPFNGKKVLVMGMGPAGFTLAHHLLMEGCLVVGADGLKIEPLDASLLNKPIYNFSTLREPLDDRVMAGFGGVAEYGITVRWDKNFLKLIYISLARRALFEVFGGVRFGGTVTVESAWQLGFDHVAVAVGAGLPRALSIPNSLAPGMRQANDFLMALQLTGAVKSSSLTNLQVRLPAVVIGGGLTGIDTATEVQAYYITQVEKTHARYHILKASIGEQCLRAMFDAHDLLILDEFLAHADAILAEREKARVENRNPDLTKLVRSWGGVSIVYRKSMQESPAYQRNHEEIIKALEEGIYYAQGLEPKAVVLDEYGDTSALNCRWRIQDEEGKWIFSSEEQSIPAKSIFVATGAKPNVAYAFEHKGTLEKKSMNYVRYELVDGTLHPVESESHIKSNQIGVFTNYDKNDRRVSFIGDTHPVFHGSVVKAIASAKRSYPEIMRAVLSKTPKQSDLENSQAINFKQRLKASFTSEVVSIDRVNSDWINLVVKAPLYAKQFSPGQFYRIQGYENDSVMIEQSQLLTEAVSALGIFSDDQPDQLRFVIKDKGTSTKVLALLKPKQRVAIMGPTGVKAQIPETPESVVIVGDSMAVPYLLSVGPALKAAGHNIVFICQLSENENPLFSVEVSEIAHSVSWVSADKDLITYITSDMTNEITRADKLIVIAHTKLQKKIQNARQAALKTLLKPTIKCIASVYGPMQCMLKGVCAQCLQWQIDPETGERTKAVYACSWQHQPMEMIDMSNIDERLGQNKMQERLTSIWLDYLFKRQKNETTKFSAA